MMSSTIFTQFQSPQWLWLLSLLCLYIFVWLRWYSGGNSRGSSREDRSHSISIADVDIDAQNHFYHPLVHRLIEQSKEKTPDKSRWLPAIVKALALGLLVIALAQPVLIGERLPNPPPERDIVFLVDTSVSMQLKDYEVQGEPIMRMQLLRNLLDEFASNMQGERIAVVVFGEEPLMLVPLTNDQGLIRRMLERITTTLAGRYSAVGDALLMALSLTKDSKRHQTFILFTDTHESVGNVTTSAAATLVAEHNIPVFTVAIGSSLSDDESQYRAVTGGLYQAVNLALLEDISKQTQGKSYQVNDSKAMQKALKDISKQRQNVAIPKPRYEQKQLYHYPLLLALLMLLLQQGIRLLGHFIARYHSLAQQVKGDNHG